MSDSSLARKWFWHSMLIAFIAVAPAQVAAMSWDGSLPPLSRLSAAEASHLQEKVRRDGVERAMDQRVTNALGLTSPSGPPLTLRALGLSDPSHGDAYFLTPLPDGKLLVGRREPMGTNIYWILVAQDYALERAVLVSPEGATPLGAEQAGTELGRIVAFLRSHVPQ